MDEASTDALKLAIQNNHDLYHAIFADKGVPTQCNEEIWYCLHETPPLYSNLVTRDPLWQPEAIFHQIDANFRQQGWPEWSIKDSFAQLELGCFGFELLFEARWWVTDASDFRGVAMPGGVEFRQIQTPAELEQWRRAWDPDLALGRAIFDDALLQRPDVLVVAGFRGDAIEAGALLNQTSDAWGLSNVFGCEGPEGWSKVLEFAWQRGIARLLGYERLPVGQMLESLGGRMLGPLRIWLKLR